MFHIIFALIIGVIPPVFSSITPNSIIELPDSEKKIIESLKGVTISYSLKDTNTHKNIASYRGDTPIVAASLTKILTTYFALNILDPDFSFKTYLKGTGKIEDGKYTGDIYLVGSGDPLLNDSHLQNLVLILATKEIKEIKGNFYYDDSEFINLEQISDLGVGDAPYNPGISALNSHFNRMTLFNNSPLLDIPSFKVNTHDPSGPSNSDELTNFTPSQRFLLKTKNPETWAISPKAKLRSYEDLPIRNPSVQTAERLRFLAGLHGINLRVPSFKKAPRNATVLAQISSIPLWQIAKLTLEYSNNLVAESLLLKAALKISKGYNLYEAGKVMVEQFQKQFPSINFSGVQIVGGSGLSHQTLISTQTLTDFLSEIKFKSFGEIHFFSLLNLAKNISWMRKSFHSNELAYRVWVKTGSLDYVSNIAGYLHSKSGRTLSFTLSLIDEKKRNQLNSPDSYELKELRESAPRWRAQAFQVIYNLLYSWYQRY